MDMEKVVRLGVRLVGMLSGFVDKGGEIIADS